MEPFEQSAQKLAREVRSQTTTYMVTALGLVAGLAWNDAIKALIEYVFPFSQQNFLIAKFGYAIIITLGVVFITRYLVRLLDVESAKQ